MIGRALSHFEITAKLGEGGMGEVYRATDTRLAREVAIKVLPEAFVADAERLARFEREARLLAALDHANVAGIYEVGEHEGTHFLVMQLAEGEDLSARIARGPVPFQEALQIALQIVAALEAAHAKGIVHRDLKPANVMLDAQGRVKVLDFGLAKAFASPGETGGDALISHSPTITVQRTNAGVILGSAAYMSPEQAKGQEADKRADIWAFGVVLTEMLSGRRVFDEPTLSETLASVLKSTPDLTELPAGVPRPIRTLLERCLRKDPRERLHDIADARLVLEDVAAGRIEEVPRAVAPGRWLPHAAVALLVGLLLGSVAMWLVGGREVPTTPKVPPRRFVVDYGDLRESRPELSPDGHRVAYSKESRIWVRDLRSLETIPIPGTERGTTPVWSPDGEWLAFGRTGDGLWKIRLDGSGATPLSSEVPGPTSGGTVWLEDGRILFVTGRSGVLQVHERGGDTTEFSSLLDGEADFHFLAELPHGKGFLTTPHRGDVFETVEVILPDGERREVLRLEGYPLGPAVYSPTGHLMFVRYPLGLWAVPFSIDELATTGDPFPVASSVMTVSSIRDGSLVYASRLPPVEAQVVLVNRLGQVERALGEPIVGLYPAPALSPDGRTVVAPVNGRQGSDLWSFGLDGAPARRLTFDEANLTTHPAWTPDGKSVYYTASERWDDVTIWRIPSDGGRERDEVLAGSWPPAFTRDGRTMIYGNWSAGFNWNLWMRDVDQPGEGTPLLTDDGWEIYPSLSPDDRLLAYSHDGHIYVRNFPDMGGLVQVAEGQVPVWSPKGDRLYFTRGDDMMEAVFRGGSTPRFEPPERLFTFVPAPAEQGAPSAFAVTPDGERFVMVRSLEPPPGIVVVQNWLETLE